MHFLLDYDDITYSYNKGLHHYQVSKDLSIKYQQLS